MSSLNLLPGMATLRPKLGGIVEHVEAKAPYASVLLSARQGLRIDVDNRREEVMEIPPTAGTVVTAFDGAVMRERGIWGYDYPAIDKQVKDFLEGARFENGREIDPGPERQGDFVTEMEIDPLSLSIEDKLERCRSLHQRMQGMDERIVNVRVNYAEAGELSVFRNRTADLAQRVQRLRLMILVVVAGEQGVRYDWRIKALTGGWEALEFTDEELQILVKRTVALLSADRIEPGEYTVIAAPSVSGTICHESFGHGVETDMFLKDRAKAENFIDRKVGSPLVNITDTPNFPGAFGAYFFDDEGQIASSTKIVEEGVFRRGLTDLYSATVLDIPRSANGRRQDFERKVYARMSNTYFEPGDTKLSDLIGQVEDGIYLDKFSSGMEDPKGWGIQVTCHYGHEIKNGKLTERMFAPIGVTGYVPEMLESVVGLSDELGMSGGFCGKGHKETVWVSSGGPHMLMKARLS